MSGSRRSTVYDLSSLRLRPDGTRIQRSRSANSSLRYAAVATLDTQGNWFSQDASGPRTVAKYRNVREDDNDGETIELQEGEPLAADRSVKGKEREKSERSDPRPVKRQKFMDDLDFITSASKNSLPSSDLLKALHFFASNYYHERGQLLNVTKEYRRLKKINRLARSEQQREDGTEDGETDLKQKRPVRRGGRIKGKGKTVYPTDMYRMFDGTALLAIGMLLEEYVDKLLQVRKPDGWDDMMLQAEDEAQEDASDSDDGQTDAEDNEHMKSSLVDEDGTSADDQRLDEQGDETDDESEEGGSAG